MTRRVFGDRLKALRQQKGLAQERLAESLGVSRNTVNRWEMGERSPSLPMIERIAAALGLAIDAVVPDLAADRGRGPLSVPARLLEFDPAVMSRQAGSGPLLSLMAIVNDIRTLRRLLIVSQERLRDHPTVAESGIFVGESGYFFRSLVRGVNARRLAGELVLTPHPGLGRYCITDAIATLLTRKALRVPSDGFREFQKRFYEKMDEVIRLAEALAVVLDHTVEHLVERNVKNEEQSAIRVDPLIARARRKVEAARKKRKQK